MRFLKIALIIGFLFLPIISAFAQAGHATFEAVSASDITGTASTAVKTAGTGGERYYVTSITISNMAAAVATRVDVLDGTTVIWSCGAPVAGGGCSIDFARPLRLTANTAINCQCGTNAAAVRCAIAGYAAFN